MILTVFRGYSVSSRFNDTPTDRSDDAGYEDQGGSVIFAHVVHITHRAFQKWQGEPFIKADDYQGHRPKGKNQKTEKNDDVEHTGDHISRLFDLSEPDRKHHGDSLAITVEPVVFGCF